MGPAEPAATCTYGPGRVVRTDLDTSAAAAGAPANDPDWLRMNESAPADIPNGSTIGLTAFDNACMKAHGREAGPVG